MLLVSYAKIRRKIKTAKYRRNLYICISKTKQKKQDMDYIRVHNYEGFKDLALEVDKGTLPRGWCQRKRGNNECDACCLLQVLYVHG